MKKKIWKGIRLRTVQWTRSKLREKIYGKTCRDFNKDNENVKCDVLLIPCGGKYTFNAKEAAEYTARIKPGIAIPTHYTDEPGRSGIPMTYKNELQRLDDGIKVEILI